MQTRGNGIMIINRCSQCGRITFGLPNDWEKMIHKVKKLTRTKKIKFTLCPECQKMYNQVADQIIGDGKK
jgi:uncharacterized protein with PIN domain